MALEGGYQFAAHIAAHAPPTPTDTPSRDVSRRASHHDSSSAFSERAPAAFAPGESYFSDMSKTDSIASWSNPRFSQNLDISFIGEIHSLKKELERKDLDLDLARKKITSQKTGIGELEEAVDMLVAELTQFREESKTRAAKERSLEQMKQAIQDESNLSLAEFARERDAALKREDEVRKNLEAERARKRTVEGSLEDAYRSHERERQKHNMEVRNMDRKHHILENRLKIMVDEVKAVHLAASNPVGTLHDRRTSLQESWSIEALENNSVRPGSRAGSRMSNRSHDELHGDRDAMGSRASVRSAFARFGATKINGISLAEELGDEHSEGDEEEMSKGEREAHSENPFGFRRCGEDAKARKIMGLPSDAGQSVAGTETRGLNTLEEDVADTEPLLDAPEKQYVEAGTQVSRPASPASLHSRVSPILRSYAESTTSTADKLRSPSPSQLQSMGRTSPFGSHASSNTSMVSTSCQTIDIVSKTPPYTEVSTPPANHSTQISTTGTNCASTQTKDDLLPEGMLSASSRLSPRDVPVIAIHPPGSRPSSSHATVVLPPRTKSAACQVEYQLALRSTMSSSTQTDAIRVDKRPPKIPSMIRTTHIATKARSPARKRSRSMEKRVTAMAAAPSKTSRRHLRGPVPFEEQPCSPPVPSIGDFQFLPGLRDSVGPKNDTGPLTSYAPAGPRRPMRGDSIFAGFDDQDDLVNDYSDDNSATAAPVRKTLSKVKDAWSLVPHRVQETEFDRAGVSDAVPYRDAKGRSSPTETHVAQTTSKTFRLQNNVATSQPTSSHVSKPHQKRLDLGGANGPVQRSRSPSEPNTVGSGDAPPYPVPTRSSSRRIPMSASDGAASPSPYTTSFFTTHRGQRQARPYATPKILRKVQSAAAVSKPREPRRRPPPPPPPFKKASVTSLASPRTRQPSHNQFILPFSDEFQETRTEPSLLSEPRTHPGEASIDTPDPQATVVDAIAQTMVGEWMWKYVRKRTSYGITETAQTEVEMRKASEAGSMGGVRHKRWVWLAPYERAVIWSSKQPTSGPALLGKGGRKLTIKSVLDVKDDTPLPKGSESQAVFDRSILILTPQRALKFTAVSRERHYIWLSALSFLSHSTQGMDELAMPDPILQPNVAHNYLEDPESQGQATTRWRGHRGSLRLNQQSRPKLGTHSLSSPASEHDVSMSLQSRKPIDEIVERPSEDAAEPPQIPRLHGHARKRSSTGPRIPVSSFSNYGGGRGGGTAGLSSLSLQSSSATTTRDKQRVSSRAGSYSHAKHPFATPVPIDESGPLPPTPAVRNDFFDAVGTVRMEAFVHRTAEDPAEKQRKKTTTTTMTTATTMMKKKTPKQKAHKKKMSYWGVTDPPITSVSESSGMGWRDDPFRGF